MDVQIILSDQTSKENICLTNIDNPEVLTYEDSDKATNVINVFKNGLRIKRVASTHETFVYLMQNESSFIQVRSKEGNFKIDVKVLEFHKGNDNISLVYIIQDEKKYIEIRYTGVY